MRVVETRVTCDLCGEVTPDPAVHRVSVQIERDGRYVVRVDTDVCGACAIKRPLAELLAKAQERAG